MRAVLLANTDGHGNGQHHSVTNSDVITYINSDSDRDSNANGNANTYTYSEIESNAALSPQPSTTPLSSTL